MKTTKFRPEVLLYSGIVIVSTAIFYLSLGNDNDRRSNWITAAFHVVSASTTSRFQFIDISVLSTEGKIVLIMLMLIGRTAFSTAGGIKAGRILKISLRLTKRTLQQILQPGRFPLCLPDTMSHMLAMERKRRNFEQKRPLGNHWR
jgi:trk system potassium uptake protein TrkH